MATGPAVDEWETVTPQAQSSEWETVPSSTKATPTPKAQSLMDRYNAAVEPYTRIDPHVMPHSASDIGREAVKGLGNIGAGALGVLLHPIDTVEGAITGAVRMSPPGEAYDMLRGNKTADEELAESLSRQPLETVEQMLGQAGATEGVGKAVGPMTRALKATAKSPIDVIAGTGQRATKALVKETQLANEEQSAKIAEKNAVQASDRAQQVKKYGEKVADVREANATTNEVKNRKAALNRGVERLDSEVKDDLEAEEHKVNQTANQKYNELAEKLNPIEASREFLPNALSEASEKIKGSNTEPTILKDMEKKVSRGDEMTYEDLQGYRSELNRELRKGSLPGDIFHAYKGLQDSITGEMERIAGNNGQGPQFKDARDYYRNYAETFLDRDSPVRKALDSTERGQTTRAFRGKDQSGIEAVARYNAELAKRINTVRGYADEASSIRKSSAVAKEEPNLPAKPQPAVVVPKTIGTEDIRGAKTEAIANRAESIRNKGGGTANAIAALGAIRDVFTGNMAGLGETIAARTAYGVGKSQLANLLERPSVVKFLTEPTASDIAQIPPELRGNIGQLAQAAKDQGIKVSPALSAAVAVATPKPEGSKTQYLKKLRDSGAYTDGSNSDQ